MIRGVGKKRRGIALLLAVGILGLLSLIGISFAMNMLLTLKETENFANSVKAKYIAEAGVKRAIMDIRARVTSTSYANLKTYVGNYVASSGTNVPFGEGTYTLTITSEEDKVNLNTFDETDARQINILDNFLTYQQIANIIDYRDKDSSNTTINGASGNIEGTAQCKNAQLDTIEEMRVATGISKAVFDANRDEMTVSKPIIRGGLLGRYYNAISGVSPNVVIDKTTFVKKVVELGPVYQSPTDTQLPGTDGHESNPADAGWSETHDAEFAGGSSVADIVNFGLDGFGVIWDGYIEILPAEVNTPITFWVKVDDGAKLFLDDNTSNVLQGTSWQDQVQTEYSGNYTFQIPGWHKIRLEYYDGGYENTVMLKWKGGSWAAASVIPAERLGYDPLMNTGLVYNHAGIYTISSTASVLKSGQTAATRQVTATVEVFGTWTQTTKEEFYAAWFNEQGNFRDGEVFNVNWLDSCPTEADYWDAGASRMRWEGGYANTPDSVKLGYWDNFDEDPGYSTAMMKGYQYNRAWWGYGTLNISFQDIRDNDGDGDNEIYIDCNTFEAKHFELNRNYFRPSTPSVFVRAYVQQPAPSKRIAWRGSGTVYDGPLVDGHPREWPLYSGSSRKVYYYDQNGNGVFDGDLPSHTGEPEVYPVYDAADNPVYIYSPTSVGSWDLDDIPVPGSYNYYQPEPPFCGCWLYAKGNADDPRDLPQPPRPGSLIGYGFKTLHTDGDGYVQWVPEPRPLWPDGDTNEIRLGQGAFTYTPFNYVINAGRCTEALSIIGSDNGVSNATYYGWINGTRGNNLATWADWSKAYPNGPIFKFVANNQYLGWDWADFDRGQHLIGPSDWDKGGAVTTMQTHWDDIRCIPASGYLVSAPFYTGANVRWGTISWSAQTSAANTVDVYTRTATSYANIPTTDSSWTTAAANGAAIGGTAPWVQYKIILAKSDINKDQYSASSQTPVLEDITCTYIPTVQIKYWREGT